MQSFKTYAGAFDDADIGYFGATSRYSYNALKDGYTQLWQGMVVLKTGAANREAAAVVRGKDRLLALQQTTGVPWFVIGLLILREAGLRNNELDWGACLHNGERIIGTGRKTRLVPKGRGPFNTFEEAAEDALADYAGATWSPEFIAYTGEKFNGFGYRNHGIPTPYLWGGTNRQRSGKYVADGVYNASVMDPQLGMMAVLKAIMAMDASASFDRAAKRATDVAEQPLTSSGINQGAVAGGGLTLTGILTFVWDKLQYADDRIMSALGRAAGEPVFWILLAILGTCALVIWKRKELRDQLRGTFEPTPIITTQEDTGYVVAQTVTRRRQGVRLARQARGRRDNARRSTNKRQGRARKATTRARG